MSSNGDGFAVGYHKEGKDPTVHCMGRKKGQENVPTLQIKDEPYSPY